MDNTRTGFWEKVTEAFTTDQEPEPIDPASIELGDWEANRSALGVPDNGDTVGVTAWRRPSRYVPNEVSEMEAYAARRTELGIREAPQASAGNPRRNATPHRAV
jgi:hypothetical protein